MDYKLRIFHYQRKNFIFCWPCISLQILAND